MKHHKGSMCNHGKVSYKKRIVLLHDTEKKVKGKKNAQMQQEPDAGDDLSLPVCPTQLSLQLSRRHRCTQVCPIVAHFSCLLFSRPFLIRISTPLASHLLLDEPSQPGEAQLWHRTAAYPFGTDGSEGLLALDRVGCGGRVHFKIPDEAGLRSWEWFRGLRGHLEGSTSILGAKVNTAVE